MTGKHRHVSDARDNVTIPHILISAFNDKFIIKHNKHNILNSYTALFIVHQIWFIYNIKKDSSELN